MWGQLGDVRGLWGCVGLNWEAAWGEHRASFSACLELQEVQHLQLNLLFAGRKAEANCAFTCRGVNLMHLTLLLDGGRIKALWAEKWSTVKIAISFFFFFLQN